MLRQSKRFRLAPFAAALALAAPALALPAPQETGAAPFVLEDVQIGGEVIPAQAVKRALVYTVGTRALEERKLDVFIEQEMKRQLAAGADPARFLVGDEEVDSAMAEAEEQIKQQYPTLDVEDVLRSNDLPPERWRDQLTQAKLFDRVFLPSDPDEWPETTVAAMEGGERGPEFVEKIKESFRQQKEAADNAEGDPEVLAAQRAQGEGMLKMIMRQLVMGALTENATIKMGSDGLPYDVAMEVNGVSILTDDIYEILKGRLTAEDHERTLRWIGKTTAVRQALQEPAPEHPQGYWIGDEEWRTVFAEHEAPFAGSPISLDVLVMNFKKFPSRELYKEYYRLLKSYERSIQDQLVDEVLADHLKRASDLMGLAKVDAEVILISAFDFLTRTWKEGGFEAAEQRAVDVVNELAALDPTAANLEEAAAAKWASMVDEHSEFWDPPTPASPTMQQPQVVRMNKGRFGLLNRNEMVQRLGESEYTMFLDGSSVADFVFFEQEPGSIDGPFRGQFGYYITRVKGRTPPQQMFSLANANQRDLIVQDYVSLNFNRFAEEVLAKSFE